ncbi:MAG: DUF1329 domain-containing protein [Pseudomonadota bacterium]
MHIKKYTRDWTRRAFLQKTAVGVAGAGLLRPLWSQLAHADDLAKAYPEELLSIEAYTKGALRPGDLITVENVESVAELLDPLTVMQVQEMGRQIELVESTTDISRLFPYEYLEATAGNQGKAAIDANGNVVVSATGEPWIGGNPFPEPANAEQTFANLVMSWGRHDDSVYAVRDWDISPSGKLSYQYDFVWAEQNTTCRVASQTPYIDGEEDKLRYQAVWFTSPADAKGTAFLNTWKYDQREFPDLVGYLPAFKRVRRFPTNQRFEPLVPGITIFLSDAWAAGDPMLTWGNYKIVGTKPMLGAVSGNWTGDQDKNWERGVHGGPEGATFFDTRMELCPEVIVLEAEPVGYPRAPVSKKRVYIDARNMMFIGYVTFDRRGEMWKTFEPSFSQYATNGVVHNDGSHPAWSWTHVHSHDVQSNRMSRFVQARQLPGGHRSVYNMGPDIYSRYLTPQAIRRFGT